jgi:hypothetical protein
MNPHYDDSLDLRFIAVLLLALFLVLAVLLSKSCLPLLS